MVIAAGGGYPPDSTPCIAVDGKTQYMGLDAVSAKQFKEMNGNFINLSPPGAASAQASMEALVKNPAVLPKTAKVAVLRSDYDYATDAYAEVDKILKRENYNVVYSEAMKIANLPTADANKNVALAVEKVKAAGATHAISMLNFTNFVVFPPEATKAGLTLKYSMIEISAGMCIAFSAGQLPPEMDGAPCLTHWNNFRVDTAGTKADRYAVRGPVPVGLRSNLQNYADRHTRQLVPTGDEVHSRRTVAGLQRRDRQAARR
jgi:hypothetical protein